MINFLDNLKKFLKIKIKEKSPPNKHPAGFRISLDL